MSKPKPIVGDLLSRDEVESCITTGAAIDAFGFGKEAQLIPQLVDASVKTLLYGSLITGVPLGIMAHVLHRKVRDKRLKERELDKQIQYYRDAATGIEHGLAGMGVKAGMAKRAISAVQAKNEKILRLLDIIARMTRKASKRGLGAGKPTNWQLPMLEYGHGSIANVPDIVKRFHELPASVRGNLPHSFKELGTVTGAVEPLKSRTMYRLLKSLSETMGKTGMSKKAQFKRLYSMFKPVPAEGVNYGTALPGRLAHYKALKKQISDADQQYRTQLSREMYAIDKPKVSTGYTEKPPMAFKAARR